MPPVPEGMTTAWLHENLPDPMQGWVLDPFGASPYQVIEIAQAGYRVLVSANNPIVRFVLDVLSQAPQARELRAALAELAAAYKGEERIEPHIRTIYTSECARCNQAVTVEAFLWERGATTPYGKLYTCAHCNYHSKQPGSDHLTSTADNERATRFLNASHLHYARALERVAPLKDPSRPYVEEALAAYLPRAVYVLFTLINKLAGLNLPARQKDLLAALLLSACDAGNTLWAHPSGRERPLQLTTPPRFRENNLWLALEDAVNTWSSAHTPIPIACWPDQPPQSGGICVFEGRLKNLAGELANLQIGAVAAVFPRPNQAFWTLSALWAGWLWGHEAIGPFASVLQRRRYDWTWHTIALDAALSSLANNLPEKTPFYGLISPAESSFLSAALIAADRNRFDLYAMALRDEHSPAPIHWKCARTDDSEHGCFDYMHRIGLNHVSAYLSERGEPADSLHVTAAALVGMAEKKCFRAPQPNESHTSPNLAERYNQAQRAIREVLTYRGGFLRYNANEALESGLWWLRQHPSNTIPLADRVEKAVVNYLLTHPTCTWSEIDTAICREFAGLLTPAQKLIRLCLESYAQETEPDQWQLCATEQPAARRADLAAAQQALATLAGRAGLVAQDPSPVRWVDAGGTTRYWFHLKASAMLGSLLLDSQPPLEKTYIVVPGSRANLIAYKLHHDPRLNHAIRQGCRFLKFRHLHALVERLPQAVTLETIEAQLDADPLTYSEPQMRLF
ncbi:MAG: hypothetical protein ACOYYS_07935 [Chloroflexota bacterium]